MYNEAFKDSLYSAFQPEDEECDPSFLVRLLEYFPTDKVDVESGTYDQYLYNLEKTVVDNYEKGNYQVSFFYAHLIFMSYTYYCVDHAFQTNPDRMKNLFYPINAYNGKKINRILRTMQAFTISAKFRRKKYLKFSVRWKWMTKK